MAGGTFNKQAGKVRPGTYINFESTRQAGVSVPEAGVVLVPLVGLGWGPAKTFIEISEAARDAHFLELGHRISDDNDQMLLVREAMKKAATVIVYNVGGGAKATVTEAETLTITAKYEGTRGNDIRVTAVENPTGGVDVNVYLDTEVISTYEGVTTIEELTKAAAEDGLVVFSGSGELNAISGAQLAGGSNSESTNEDISAFIDKMEAVRFNAVCFPVTETSLQTALKAKIVYMRESMGRSVRAVVPKMEKPDYEGIINVTNSVVVDGKALTEAQACAWVAGATAAAGPTTSLTYEPYDGATDIVGLKSNEEAVDAIKKGEFFFSFSEAGAVVVEYDINSLLTYDKPKDESYRKNRVMRTLDAIADTIRINFPPNKFDNSETGWEVMTGIGKTILTQFGPAPDGMGAIQDLDLDNDFLVDKSLSRGDETYFDVAVFPVDSSEKLFFTVKTR